MRSESRIAVELQSQDRRDLLDIVNNLRSLGLTRYIDLPQIIVCGDQSTGKRSVLEAISGFSFPTKDNLCTKLATELILRRDETPGVKVSIIFGPDRTQEEAFSLSTFHHEVDLAHPDLSSVVDGAKRAVGLSEAKVFSSDTLRAPSYRRPDVVDARAAISGSAILTLPNEGVRVICHAAG